jgi:hypothetical protein
MSKSNADRRNQESGTTQQNLSGIPMNQPGGHCATGKSAGRGRAKWGRAHDMAILIWKSEDNHWTLVVPNFSTTSRGISNRYFSFLSFFLLAIFYKTCSLPSN